MIKSEAMTNKETLCRIVRICTGFVAYWAGWGFSVKCICLVMAVLENGMLRFFEAYDRICACDRSLRMNCYTYNSRQKISIL